MPDSYIKSKGFAKTLIHNNNNNNYNNYNEFGWDADYDGNIANISLDLNNNGEYNHLNISLDNDDLANMLNIPSVNLPLEKRLKRDFYKPVKPKMYQIKLDPITNQLLTEEHSPLTHISSPLVGEEFVQIPPIHNYTVSHKRNYRKPKTHKSLVLYKRSNASKFRPKSSRTRSTSKKHSSGRSFYRI
jgi:hypothetical protein